MVARGSCSCGGVRYEATEVALRSHCHCTVCRKASGAAFATWGHVRDECFTLLSGADLIEQHLDANGMGREFCRRCGSLAPGKPEHMDTWSIPAGTLDDDPGVRPVAHVFTSSCAAWWTIGDDLPKFERWPPGMEPPFAREPDDEG